MMEEDGASVGTPKIPLDRPSSGGMDDDDVLQHHDDDDVYDDMGNDGSGSETDDGDAHLEQEEEMAEEALIISLSGSNTGDGVFGNDENVNRCLRRDVAEGEALVVFKNDVGRDVTGDDFFEERHASWRLS